MESVGPNEAEYKELSVDVNDILTNSMHYDPSIAEDISVNTLILLKNPCAISPVPTLKTDDKKKYYVASKSSRDGRVECVVNKAHVTCKCGCFRNDHVCKHSTAVAEKETRKSYQTYFKTSRSV